MRDKREEDLEVGRNKRAALSPYMQKMSKDGRHRLRTMGEDVLVHWLLDKAKMASTMQNGARGGDVCMQ